MSTPLSGIPIPKRRQLAATIGLFAMLFLTVGAVSLTQSGGIGYTIFQVAAFVIALLLALVSWGVVTSIQHDLSEKKLDDAIAEVVGSRPDSLCSCGHEHDPTELHVVDGQSVDADAPARDACAHDGGGAACSHDCDTCVLASLRPNTAAGAATATADRPSPRPRPRPTPTR